MTQFYAKTWIYWTQAIVFGGLGISNIILGLSLIAKVIVPANGAPGYGAGVALLIGGIIFLPVFALGAYNIAARVPPLIKLHDGGVEIRVIGATSLDWLPFYLRIVRVAWSIASGQGFRTQTVQIRRDALTGAFVYGIPMSTWLEIQYDKVDEQGERWPRKLKFHEAEFEEPLDEVAWAIRQHCHFDE